VKQVSAIAVLAFVLGAFGTYAFKELREPEPLHAVGSGRAPDFELNASDGKRVSLSDLRGQVVVLTFGFTRCGDICPMAMHKFTWMQDELGDAFGKDAQFVMITVDPAYDTPEVLSQYADRIGASPDGWSFLTGSQEEIKAITQRYGVYAKEADDGLVEHILLTSLIDRDGNIDTQFLGERFAVEEMLGAVKALMAREAIWG
jgi:protein SCO1/2